MPFSEYKILRARQLLAQLSPESRQRVASVLAKLLLMANADRGVSGARTVALKRSLQAIAQG